jgi:Zn-finger nucleic acid-binding protein
MQNLPPDITSPKHDDETWNSCPRCRKLWKDKVPTPNLIHKTTYCEDCKKHMIDEVFGHMRKG